jgi:hypothetical protein
MTIFKQYQREIAGTYIIKLRNNAASEAMAKRCMDSCAAVGQKNVEYFSAVDGTGGQLKIDRMATMQLSGVKTSTGKLTSSEYGCFLSHVLLWRKCAEMDAPIVILEHDAVMLRKFSEFPFYNCVFYLGNEAHEQFTSSPEGLMTAPGRCTEFVQVGEKDVDKIPCRYYMDRTHAYSIDSVVARRLLSKVYAMGIVEAADSFVTFDEFCIMTPIPFVATVVPGENTIDHSG